jgi:hypothetical protein
MCPLAFSCQSILGLAAIGHANLAHRYNGIAKSGITRIGDGEGVRNGIANLGCSGVPVIVAVSIRLKFWRISYRWAIVRSCCSVYLELSHLMDLWRFHFRSVALPAELTL